MDTSHTHLLTYQFFWNEKFLTEKEKIQNIFGNEALAIEHIGSTSIEGLSSKPIIDIAVLIEKRESGDKFIQPLEELGYLMDTKNVSTERHFFRKGKPTEFHLSIAYADVGGFWERQILFRDYLRNHPDVRDEYANIKKNLLKNDPTGVENYIHGKTDFILKVLELARKEKI